MKPRHDIYATVTAQLVAAIESGAGEWRMPWHHSGAPVMRPTSVAGRRYSGINRLVLWATADACGYASGIWATYQQWRANGGQVRKGAIGTHVILWKKVERGDAAAEAGGQGDSRAASSRAASSSSTAIRSMAPRTRWKGVAPVSTSVADALAFLEGLGIPVEYGLHDAYYRPDIDKVFMPERTAFDHDLDLVSTLAHEVTHASGHVDRLARETLRDYHKERSVRARGTGRRTGRQLPDGRSGARLHAAARPCCLSRQLAGCLAPRSQGDLQRRRASAGRRRLDPRGAQGGGGAFAAGCMRRAMAIASIWPDSAQAACRTMSGISPADWYPTYLDLVAAIRTHMRRDMRSLGPIHRWRGLRIACCCAIPMPTSA
jgi:antirestriction protein ArdC